MPLGCQTVFVSIKGKIELIPLVEGKIEILFTDSDAFWPRISLDFFEIFLSKLCKKGTIIYVEQSAHDKVLENDSLQNLKNSKIGEAQGSLFIKKWN